MDDALKTRDNIYLNVETSLLLAPHQNFWPRAWLSSLWSLLYPFPTCHSRCSATSPSSATHRLLELQQWNAPRRKKIASKLSRSTHPCGSFIFNDVYADQEPRSEGAERRALWNVLQNSNTPVLFTSAAVTQILITIILPDNDCIESFNAWCSALQ